MTNTEIQRKRMYRIVGAAMTLFNELGFGYSKDIYHECLAIVFDEMGIEWESEALLSMYFHEQELVKNIVPTLSATTISSWKSRPCPNYSQSIERNYSIICASPRNILVSSSTSGKKDTYTPNATSITQAPIG